MCSCSWLRNCCRMHGHSNRRCAMDTTYTKCARARGCATVAACMAIQIVVVRWTQPILNVLVLVAAQLLPHACHSNRRCAMDTTYTKCARARGCATVAACMTVQIVVVRWTQPILNVLVLVAAQLVCLISSSQEYIQTPNIIARHQKKRRKCQLYLPGTSPFSTNSLVNRQLHSTRTSSVSAV